MLRIAQDALTFDDVLLVPGYSEVLPNQVSLKTRLTRGIELNTMCDKRHRLKTDQIFFCLGM